MVHGVLSHLLAQPAANKRFMGTLVYRCNYLPGCSREREPTDFAPRAAAAAHRFNWAELPKYDAIWAEALREHEQQQSGTEARGNGAAGGASARLAVLNVSVLTSLRGDGHCEDCSSPMASGTSSGSGAQLGADPFAGLDCLHYCLPGGPMDAWSALLQDLIAAVQP